MARSKHKEAKISSWRPCVSYTLKKHKRKLKKRGLGPYVISELNNSGAVCLETLNGEHMVSFINGSRLKKFEELLIETMLQQLLLAKNRKEGLQQLKKEAREEALECKCKMKERKNARTVSLAVLVLSPRKIYTWREPYKQQNYREGTLLR